jgi:Reverse transcriptase (RNA-dependent DNA polymerase)
MFNLSLFLANFTPNMKTATVVSILKKNASEFKNYRPVSNLSFIFKVLERVVFEQNVDYIDKHELLPERQSTAISAYRAWHLCDTASLLQVHSDLIPASDAGNISLIAMLDLSAAFDRVDHDILLQRHQCNYTLALPIVSRMKSSGPDLGSWGP